MPRFALGRPALPFPHPATLVGTWFGAGLLPLFPGTWGSLAALPLAWLMLVYGSPQLLFIAAVLALLIGWWATARYLRASESRDPAEIVVDEVSGQWLALVFADPARWWQWALCFALFRLFDIAKPWPARAIEARRTALAVMADDSVAALYTLVVFALVVLLLPAIALLRKLFGGP